MAITVLVSTCLIAHSIALSGYDRENNAISEIRSRPQSLVEFSRNDAEFELRQIINFFFRKITTEIIEDSLIRLRSLWRYGDKNVSFIGETFFSV